METPKRPFPGKLFRLKGKGVKPVSGGPPGDLLCRFQESLERTNSHHHSPKKTSFFDGVKKFVTEVTPVQFQKQMRLQAARQRLLSQDDIAAVGFSVGYESPSQFNRGYRRLFGLPPGRGKERLRASLTG